MDQITFGLRAILSNPKFYTAFQFIMGAHSFRKRFVSEFIRPTGSCSILDVGCGPADILAYLPGVDYFGFDISETYIQKARLRYGCKGNFYCQILEPSDLEKMPPFDLVLALGLLHHISDEVALNTLRIAHDALKPGGRLVTIDPCLEPGQNPISRWLVTHDRGQNVRNREEYLSLVLPVFTLLRGEVRHKRWVPYTHCIMECQK